MYNRKIFFWTATVAVMLLIYTVGTTQTQNPREVNTMANADQDVDTVEVVGTPTGDDPWSELEKIIAAYYSNTGMAYKGTIKVIDDNLEKEEVLEEQAFEYSMIGNNYQSRIGEMEFINTKNNMLVIDHAGKTISYSSNSGVVKNNRLMDIRDFRRVMLEQKVNARITQMGKEKILTIDNINDPDIQGYRIYYSPVTYRINKMLIGMARFNHLDESAEKEITETEIEEELTGENTLTEYYYYLEVIYESVLDLKLKEKEFAPEKKFIRISNGKPTLMPAYEDYQFVSTIEP